MDIGNFCLKCFVFEQSVPELDAELSVKPHVNWILLGTAARLCDSLGAFRLLLVRRRCFGRQSCGAILAPMSVYVLRRGFPSCVEKVLLDPDRQAVVNHF